MTDNDERCMDAHGRISLMIGRWHGLVIDTPDPSGLAAFYQELLGMQRVHDDEGWVVIGDAPDRPGLAFQLAPDLQSPQWPNPENPQQMHLDVMVGDMEQAENRVLALGAQRLPGGGERFRVYRDPSGHPFCLCT
jgi:catechol 2,3-dioxygenase-like lactoylglutathione lyase family enzyme